MNPTDFAVVFRAETLLGEPGWSYAVYENNAEVVSGWSRGTKRDAEVEVRRAMERRR